MAEASGIEWCDSTFNPWIGCTKVSAACDNCYAEKWSARFNRAQWGNQPRERTSAATWAQPRKWQREAAAFHAAHGRPRFVFCASLADVFDNQVLTPWQADLWDLIRECNQMVWLLLTKRPQNIAKMLPDDWGNGWPHVWLGTTVEHQAAADMNVPALLGVPAAKRFLSCEPLLGPVDLMRVHLGEYKGAAQHIDALDYQAWAGHRRIDWVIAGGESGPGARPSHPDWFRTLRDQCADGEVPFFFKQWGDLIPWEWEHMPTLVSQNGGAMDRHQLPDFSIIDAVSARWSDGCLYDGDEGCVHQRVGKKVAGRRLDGETLSGRPTSTIGCV